MASMSAILSLRNTMRACRIDIAKTHVQTACEFHDLNMGFAVLTRLSAQLKIASNSYAHRYLCKNGQAMNSLLLVVSQAI